MKNIFLLLSVCTLIFITEAAIPKEKWNLGIQINTRSDARLLQAELNQILREKNPRFTLLKEDGIIGRRTQNAIEEYKKVAKFPSDQTFEQHLSNLVKQREEDENFAEKRGLKVSPELGGCDSSKSFVGGDEKNIIGCGIATNFGHDRKGGKDGQDDGNTFCNTKKEKDKYTYRSDRSAAENLKVEFAALRMDDISKLFNIPKGRKSLEANRNTFCGKMIKIINKQNGVVAEAKLMDIMSNNDKLVDLTGGVLNKLKASGNPQVEIYWADQPSRTANLRK